MAGFGGTIKLQGEQAYRQALKAIAADLKTVAAEQKLTASTYDKTDNSLTALSKRSDDLKNKLDAQKAKWTTLSNAIKDYESQQAKNKATIQSVQSQLDKEKAKLEEVARVYGESSKEYKAQAKVVDDLEQQLKELNAQYDKNQITLKQTQAALTSTEADMKKTGSELKKLGEQAQRASDGTDELGDSAKDAGKKAKDAADDGFTVLRGALADLTARGVEVAIGALKNLATAVINTAKESLASYASYEQLVGGVDTLFKESSKQVQKYAEVAYKTAGMSANTYMETVTSFSASLLQGLGGDTKKAAEIADMAIIDMADNANKMGTSIESIQYAYQGFAKDNYTMLDNLKLGYGGTQAEMARLVNESGVMGKAFKATAENVKDIPFDKLIEAIHKTQESMGITGTTAKEASSTIEGSVSSMKAAWSNLLTSIADDNADLSKSIDEFVDSAITSGQNIIPRVKQIIEGFKKLVGSLVSDVFPKLKKEMPELTPLIEPFEWIIKNYKTVVTAIGAIITAFVVTKITNFVTSVISTVSALGSAIKAADGFAGAIKGIGTAISGNPIGLLAGVLAGIVTAIIGVVSSMNEAEKEADEFTKHLEEQTEAVNANKDAYDKLSESVQNTLNAEMSNLQNVTELKNELLDLVDANGKVKEGYEGRAKFILGELNKALGTEYEMTDGVIQKYAELKQSIDSIIETKKAEALLNAQQQLYQEAIAKEAEAYQELDRIKEELLQRDIGRREIEAKIEENRNGARDMYSNLELARLEGEMAKYDEETATIQSNYDTQLGILDKYAYDKAVYEDNMAKFHEGKYDEMTTATWEYNENLKKAGSDEKSQIEAQNKTLQSMLDHKKELKKKNNTDIYDNDIKSLQEQIKANQEELKDYVSTTDKGLSDNLKSWNKGLGKQLSEITGQKVEFKDAGEGLVQMYVDGVATGEPKATAEMEKILKDSLKETTKNEKNFEQAGKDIISGFTRGEGNISLQNVAKNTASNFASSILSTLKKKLGIASPSKETRSMGQFLVQGLSLGIDKEEDSALQQAADFGEAVIDAMNEGLSSQLDTSVIQQLQGAIPEDLSSSFRASMAGATVEAAQVEQRGMISAFKEALAEMKIEMDDYEMGKFVDKTVSRAIYS